jgi:hypothetical protein
MNRLALTLIVSVVASLLLPGCAATTAEALKVSIPGAQGYKDFVPVDPLESPRVTYYDSTGEQVTKAWAQLSNEEVRKLLPNIYTVISVAKQDSSGNLTYLVAKATAEVGNYVVIMDYTKYRQESVTDEDSKRELGLGRIGVGLRMTAQVHTLKANIDLGSIFALGVAAATNKLTGSLAVHIIGITTTDVDNLTVTNAKIDETSIQKTLEGMAAIKAKIADSTTTLTPQILWVKPTSRDVEPRDVMMSLSWDAPQE